MKTKSIVLLIILFFFLSCSTEKWPREKMDVIFNSCIESGKNNASFTESETNDYCNCILDKIKNEYTDYKDFEKKNQTSTDVDVMIKMADECIEQLGF